MRFYEYNSGQEGLDLHFIAANGYPPAAYKRLFSQLNCAKVTSFLLRPLSNEFYKVDLNSWFDFADDLHDYVIQFEPKVVFGHSIGAVIWLLYSIKYNYNFDKIILIDPALFLPIQTFCFNICRFFNIHRYVHPFVLPALRRKCIFNTKEEIFRNYREKKIFQYFSNEVLWDYINSLFSLKDSKFEIIYSPKWESIIYEYGLLDDRIVWKYLSTTTTPINLISGEFSTICTPKLIQMFENKCDHFRSNVVGNTTHLLPLETPDHVADLINNLLN